MQARSWPAVLHSSFAIYDGVRPPAVARLFFDRNAVLPVVDCGGGGILLPP